MHIYSIVEYMLNICNIHIWQMLSCLEWKWNDINLYQRKKDLYDIHICIHITLCKYISMYIIQLKYTYITFMYINIYKKTFFNLHPLSIYNSIFSTFVACINRVMSGYWAVVACSLVYTQLDKPINRAKSSSRLVLVLVWDVAFRYSIPPSFRQQLMEEERLIERNEKWAQSTDVARIWLMECNLNWSVTSVSKQLS